MGTMGTLEFICLLWVAMGLRVLTITSYDENQGLLMCPRNLQKNNSRVLKMTPRTACELDDLEDVKRNP